MMRYISDTDLSEIIGDIRDLIDKQSQGALLNILVDIHPADIASILNALRKEDRKYLFGILPTETASAVISEVDAPVIEHLLQDISEAKISDIVDQMDSDDAADLISDLPDELAGKVLDQIPDAVSEEVKELLTYEEDTAGGIMALEYLAVTAENTVKEAIKAIRKAKDKLNTIHTVWVIDQQNILLGDVSLTDLVLARGKDTIASVMNTEVKSVGTDMDQEDIAIMFRKYDLVVAPVVNARHQLVGQITIDDIVDVLDEEASEDMSLFAGANDEEMLEESFLKISWFRLPWLLVAFVGQIIAALVIQRFETTLTHIIALTFFMPVIMAMGGNSGIQSSIIVIRGLATGEISMGNTWRRFFREMRVSMFIGFIFACLMTAVVGIWLQNYIMGAMVGLALNVVIIQASLFGGLIPFILKRFEIDPAMASGPFITTFNDILGLLIYLVIITTTIPVYM
jgi:magnesium transporter